MQLSKFSDYAFRALICLAKDNKLYTIESLSNELKISSNHLKKIIHKLAKNGVVASFKGRDGGIRLNLHPSKIPLSTILKHTEESTFLSECLNENTTLACPFSKGECKLKGIIHQARDEFISVFDKYTLADIL